MTSPIDPGDPDVRPPFWRQRRWAMTGETGAMGIQLKDAKDPATGEIVTSWEVRASVATEVKR
jgi:hypothetical protein